MLIWFKNVNLTFFTNLYNFFDTFLLNNIWIYSVLVFSHYIKRIWSILISSIANFIYILNFLLFIFHYEWSILISSIANFAKHFKFNRITYLIFVISSSTINKHICNSQILTRHNCSFFYVCFDQWYKLKWKGNKIKSILLKNLTIIFISFYSILHIQQI